MEEKKSAWQVKYDKKDIKYVDTESIEDFSGEAEASEDGEVKVNFKNFFDVPDYKRGKKKEDMTVAELDMEELIRGIEEFGVLVPLIVREKDGKYELLSGYRRRKAVKMINEGRMKKDQMKVPIVVVNNCDDNRAKFILVTSNAHRSRISVKERIKSCAVAYRSMCKAEPDKSHKEIAKIISDVCKVRESNVPRYSMLMNLKEELLDLICEEDGKRARKRSKTKDGKAGKIRLSVRAGVFLATLNEQQQKVLLDLLENNEDISISVKMASEIRKKFKDEPDLTEGNLLSFIKAGEGGQSEEGSAENKSELKPIDLNELQSLAEGMEAEEIYEVMKRFFKEWREVGSPEKFKVTSMS